VFNNLDSNKNGVIESTELRGVLSSRDWSLS
jgi:Ca2+-binding EF-hand superfamily protein